MPEIASPFVDCHVFRRDPERWLVLKRAAHVRLPGTWQMVSGTIEKEEKAYEAAVRELHEETGLRPLHFYQASYVNRFYLAATDQIILTPVFAAEVSDPEVRLSDEHTDYEWVDAAEARRRYPWPGQREALDVIRGQFLEAEPRMESTLDALLAASELRTTSAGR